MFDCRSGRRTHALRVTPRSCGSPWTMCTRWVRRRAATEGREASHASSSITAQLRRPGLCTSACCADTDARLVSAVIPVVGYDGGRSLCSGAATAKWSYKLCLFRVLLCVPAGVHHPTRHHRAAGEMLQCDTPRTRCTHDAHKKWAEGMCCTSMISYVPMVRTPALPNPALLALLSAGHSLPLHARHEAGQPRAAGKHWGPTYSKAADLAVEAGTLGGRGWAVPSTAQATWAHCRLACWKP